MAVHESVPGSCPTLSESVTTDLCRTAPMRQALAPNDIFLRGSPLACGRAVPFRVPHQSMIRFTRPLQAALVVGALAGLAPPCLAAPAVEPNSPESMRTPAASSAPLSGPDLVPGASSTIRLLLDLQNGQPAETGEGPARPQRPALPGVARASAPATGDIVSRSIEPVGEAPASEGGEAGVGPTVRWATTPADEAGYPDPAAAPRPARESRPSILRSMVTYLREHRLQVFVGGLLVLTLAAVGTIVSTRRQRSSRPGRKLTADRARASRPRPPDGARSR